MQFIKLNSPNFHDTIPENGQGIYKLFSLDEDERPMPIGRLPGVDKDGLLYIGCSPKRTLRERLADLIKSANPEYKSRPHIFGKKYNREVFEELRQRLPFSSLAIQFEVAPTPKRMEEALLDAYRRRFGEEPPFNSH